MPWPKYPDYAIELLKKENKNLEKSFERIWGALYPSAERDEIMLHIINAKRLINKLIEANKEESQ